VLATAAVAAEGAVRVLRPRERGPAPVPVAARAYFSAAELAKARRFRRGQLWLFGAGGAVELAVLALAALRPPPEGRRPVLTGALTAAGLTAATTVAAVPVRAVARRRARAVGLVTQSWAGWAGDVAKGLAIGGALTGAGGALLVIGRRRLGRAWWAPGAAVAVGFSAAVTYAGPVLLDPIFNRFTTLPEGEARSDVLALARRAGVEVGEVYEVDASRRTTAANAYVTGLGRTKRVVLFDTLLSAFTPAELRLVVAHELAHVRFRDVRNGLLWMALVAPVAALAAARVAEALERPGRSPVPAVALAAALVAPPLTTIANRLSRAIERRADRYALTLTREPQAMIDFERRITVRNVADPDPPALVQALLGTHPDTMERIGAALAFGGGTPPARAPQAAAARAPRAGA
jgi:STE24 endopeptidase